MKHFFCLFLPVILLLNFSSCTSTKTNTDTKKTDILGVWYPRKPNSKYRVRISEKLFITEAAVNIENFKDGNTVQFKIEDTIKIIEKKFMNNKNAISFIMSRQKNGETQYNSFLFSLTEVKGIKTVFSPTGKGFQTIEEAKNAMKEAKFKNISQELFFSEEYTEKVFPTLKPMEKITKEDYITVVKYVRSFEEELKDFVIEKFGKDDEYIQYEMKEIAQKLANKKFYFLGYNPNDLPKNGEDYLKKFEGDKDIEELNKIESEIKF